MNKKDILVSITKEFFNSTLLKKRRKEIPYSSASGFRKYMSKAQVGRRIGVTGGQICRYESTKEGRQYPKLRIFKRLCILFQIDPKDLLGLTWINGSLVDQDGKLHLDPEKNFINEYRVCHNCHRLFIDYKESRKNYEKKANK